MLLTRGDFFWKGMLASLFLGSLTFQGWGEAWPSYRGPSQNGISAEKGWSVPPSGAPILWKAQVGIGTSSIVAYAGLVFTMGSERGSDVVRCLDAANGREQWRYEYKASLDPNLFEGGTRSTPTLAGGCLYALGHEGQLVCLDGQSGRLIWQRHLVADLGGRKPEWGYSGAPLVYGDFVIVDCGADGASTVALHRGTGAVVWRSGSDKAGYASPVVFTMDGVPTLLLFKAEALIGLDPSSGAERWRFPWKTSYNIHAATPLPLGPNHILIASGYNAGAALVSVQGGEATRVWSNKNLRSHINSPVFVAGAVFGIDGNTGGGNLVCLDPATGEKRWEEKSVKGGALVSANGKLIIVSEKGELVIAEANAAAFRPIARQFALSRRTWAQPTLSDGRLFLRDNLGSLVCLDLRSGDRWWVI